jgi:2-haloacid dehalogenase
MQLRAYIFDAYGTLFDVHSVIHTEGHGIPGDLTALSQLWRKRQVEFTWRRALMQRYENFWHVTGESLEAALAELQIDSTDFQRAKLIEAYLSPRTFPEVPSALDQLKGFPLAILSNGTPNMLKAAVEFNGLAARFAHILSVDTLKTYKPSPAVYALGPQALGIPAEEILFISANAWDAAGAKSFGYRTCWCNRSNAAPDVLGFAPDITIRRLDELTRLPIAD